MTPDHTNRIITSVRSTYVCKLCLFPRVFAMNTQAGTVVLLLQSASTLQISVISVHRISYDKAYPIHFDERSTQRPASCMGPSTYTLAMFSRCFVLVLFFYISMCVISSIATLRLNLQALRSLRLPTPWLLPLCSHRTCIPHSSWILFLESFKAYYNERNVTDPAGDTVVQAMFSTTQALTRVFHNR